MLPPALQYAFAVVIGLCIGSFLNVVVHRLPVMMQRAWQAE
ncbi:prepilin peptidase, partial [Burkholderia cenocepacia]